MLDGTEFDPPAHSPPGSPLPERCLTVGEYKRRGELRTTEHHNVFGPSYTMARLYGETVYGGMLLSDCHGVGLVHEQAWHARARTPTLVCSADAGGAAFLDFGRGAYDVHVGWWKNVIRLVIKSRSYRMPLFYHLLKRTPFTVVCRTDKQARLSGKLYGLPVEQFGAPAERCPLPAHELILLFPSATDLTISAVGADVWFANAHLLPAVGMLTPTGLTLGLSSYAVSPVCRFVLDEGSMVRLTNGTEPMFISFALAEDQGLEIQRPAACVFAYGTICVFARATRTVNLLGHAKQSEAPTEEDDTIPQNGHWVYSSMLIGSNVDGI